MRLELPLLLVFLACVASEAYQPFSGRGQYPYYYQNPYYKSNGGDLRQLMFSMGLPSRQTTVTVTTTVRPPFTFPAFPTLSLPTLARPPQRQTLTNRRTSTSTITCTKSTSVRCVVKTASPLLMVKNNTSTEAMQTTTAAVEEDIEEQFTTIAPSTVETVEITAVPTKAVPTAAAPTAAAPSAAASTATTPNRKVPNRKGRAAIDSEFSLSPDFTEDYPENQAHDIQSAFYSDPFDPVALPFFRRYTEPDISQHRQSSFFDLLGSLFRSRTTYTVFEIKTSTLTPTCSVAGPLPQCPNL